MPRHYKRILVLSYFIAILSFLPSCVSQKKITYFQNENLANDGQVTEISKAYIAKIQAGDIISVAVSSLSPEASAMFNPYQTMVIGQTQVLNNTIPQVPGYLVNEDGYIILPIIGKIQLIGLTTKESTELITKLLEKYLQQPTVNIRILNFKISVLGEVTRPSVYTISNEKITLPEAISLAGDLTIFGKRKNILLIREADGKREFARIDLTQRDLFNSPYYYLRANDVIYVEPGRGKVTSSERAVQLAPILISGLTLLIVLSNILLR